MFSINAIIQINLAHVSVLCFILILPFFPLKANLIFSTLVNFVVILIIFVVLVIYSSIFELLNF